MHTSTRLSSADIQWFRNGPTGAQAASFTDFCPDYHELDRVGVVSPTLEAGVYHTSHALLALTTAFYDCLRLRGQEFFDYPQHFAFVGSEGDCICTNSGLLPVTTPKVWDAWSWLDVWPANKWVTAPVAATGMVQRLFDYQINRLFWPQSLQPKSYEAALPSYVGKMLRTRLKEVYYYDDTKEGQLVQRDDQITVCIAPEGNRIVQESLNRLPTAVPATHALPTTQSYTRISIDDFLDSMFAL
jgi:hypothetical protein